MPPKGLVQLHVNVQEAVSLSEEVFTGPPLCTMFNVPLVWDWGSVSRPTDQEAQLPSLCL